MQLHGAKKAGCRRAAPCRGCGGAGSPSKASPIRVSSNKNEAAGTAMRSRNKLHPGTSTSVSLLVDHDLRRLDDRPHRVAFLLAEALGGAPRDHRHDLDVTDHDDYLSHDSVHLHRLHGATELIAR